MLKKLFCLLLFMPLFMAQGVKAEIPEGVDSFNVGDLEIMAILDAETSMEASLLPQLSEHPELKPLFDHGPLPAVAKTYLLETNGHKILFDAGWGDEQNIKGHTLKLLEKMGIKPADITDIVMTHLDYDHTGGLTKDGKAVFPNATIWISQPEYDGWINNTPAKRPAKAVERARAIPEIYKGRVKTFKFGDEILPGITAVDANGHTPGHTAYDIKSGNDKMTIAGDVIHIAEVQLPHPEMSTIYDIDEKEAALSRKRLLEQAAKDQSLFAGMHFKMVSPVREGQDGAYFMRQPR